MTLLSMASVEEFMLKSLFFTALAAVVAAGIGYADQSTPSVIVRVDRTAPSSGKQMFLSYCAPCHGVDGRGNGPAARDLKTQPADLSLLSKAHGGKFPSEHVISVLQYGVHASEHRTAEMPVWGPMFSRMDPASFQPGMRLLRVSNLSHYIESMQAR
jgi:mono/diheme cytochrome c family protein